MSAASLVRLDEESGDPDAHVDDNSVESNILLWPKCGGDRAVAALKEGSKVITWGAPQRGGDSNVVAAELQSGVANVVGNKCALAALKILLIRGRLCG